MTRPHRAATGGVRPYRAGSAGSPLSALLALAGLLIVLGTFAEPPRSAPAPRAPSAVSSAGAETRFHDTCAVVSCGAPAPVYREAPGERPAPPPGGAGVPRPPWLPEPGPGAPSRQASGTVVAFEPTVLHAGRAPPPPADT